MTEPTKDIPVLLTPAPGGAAQVPLAQVSRAPGAPPPPGAPAHHHHAAAPLPGTVWEAGLVPGRSGHASGAGAERWVAPAVYPTVSTVPEVPSAADDEARLQYARDMDRIASMRAEYRRLVADIYARDPMISAEAAMKRADLLFQHFVHAHFSP